MARAAQRRGKRAKSDARRRRARGGARVGEQTLFFTRLRRQAKWVFVFLALVFAVGFVIFGVGSGSTGIGDLLSGNFNFGGRTSSQPSVSKAQERIKKNPRNAAAYRELATALETKGRSDEAIAPLEQYTRLRPKDIDALRELAGLYVTRASALRDEARLAQFNAQAQLGGLVFAPASTSPLGQALTQDPITQALYSSAKAPADQAFLRMQSAFGQAVTAYKRLAARSADDPSVQLELAFAAQEAGDARTAITAYKRFLKLAPDSPDAPNARQNIKQLQSSLAGTPSR